MAVQTGPDPTSEPLRLGRGMRWTVRAGMLGAVLGWLWPIGLGGKMPVGGDVTQFSIGLMAFLRESLHHGHWPLWNDLWGFGFPALAESQIGFYYPPHWGYALLSAESAYTASLVIHFLWGSLGAAWMARRFGVSELGSALSGFVWVSSGFFLIHLPHQWAYTVGSWMPWAWGLAWQIGVSRTPGRLTLILAAVLAIQVLPGHFQLAFVTEVGVLVLALAGSILGRGWRTVAGVIGAGLMAIVLAGAQWVPTLALSRLAGSDRGFEYLSGFAASPLHLVNYVAPGLFHRSPLWRPLAWDVFHTAPEEYLGYVGLVPLLLAVLAVQRGWRTSVAVRVLVVVGVVTLALGLGPYFPGFRGLIRLPGFSFFRAPARWSLATALVLAVLAGLGFDQVRRAGWTRRLVLGFGAGCVLAVALVVAGLELALMAASPHHPELQRVFDGSLHLLPWGDEPGEPSLARVMTHAVRPQNDLRVQVAQARLDGRPFPPGGLTLERERGRIYGLELLGSGLVLAALIVIGLTCHRRPRTLATLLVGLTLVELIAQAQARHYDLGPIRSLVAQSPVLARVAASPRGTRTLDPAQNLFLVAGGNAATAYRTLTLPAPTRWLDLIRQREPGDPQASAVLRALGIEARILGPFEPTNGSNSETIRDPALAGWLHGADFARINRVETFRWVPTATPTSRAWRTNVPPVIVTDPATAARNPLAGFTAFRAAQPLAWRSPWPERFEVDYDAQPGAGPAWVVIAQTFDPEWSATWLGPDGATRPATVELGPVGLQAVRVEPLAPGRWTLRLDYQGQAARWGLLVSAVGWVGWFAAIGMMAASGRRHAKIKAASSS